MVFATPGVFDIWVIYFASAWAHFQGALSAIVVLFKQDFNQAFRDFLSCRTWAKNRAQLASRRSSAAVSSWILAPASGSGIPTQSTATNNSRIAGDVSGGDECCSEDLAGEVSLTDRATGQSPDPECPQPTKSFDLSHPTIEEGSMEHSETTDARC